MTIIKHEKYLELVAYGISLVHKRDRKQALQAEFSQIKKTL